MELIKRTSLYFREGASDKVYEVDLYRLGENRYTVNFRYGRRGAKLKEGTKTEQPVPLAQAERVFDKLVGEKVKKGYQEMPPARTGPASSEPAPNAPVAGNPRHQAILNRLARRDNNKWPVERAIWRAGELQIPEATSLLIQLIGTGEPLRNYCIAWALGWCGDESAIAPLQRLCDSSNPEFVRRIAWEARFKLFGEPVRQEMRAGKIEQLPSELRDLARNGSSEAFLAALRAYLDGGDSTHFAVLDAIYQIDNEHVRPALLSVLRDAPVKPNYFRQIRHIFKMAEYRHDAEVFGTLAYRFERESGMFHSDTNFIRLPDGTYLRRREWNYNTAKGRHEQVQGTEFEREMQSPNCRIAYSDRTREYLRRRVWRTLEQLAEEGDPDYVRMAAGVLLVYSDADAQEVRHSNVYRWERSTWRTIVSQSNWDVYAGYLTFNHILYENSPRYELKPGSQAWRCQDNYTPGNPEPQVREEAFPELWERHPEALLELLLQSNCRPVHQFAAKAMRACRQFCAELNIETVIALLGKTYEVTALLGFELARERYNPAEPNRQLVLAAVNCVSLEARAQAYRWIEEQRERFFEESDFIAALVTSSQADTRRFARRLLGSSILSDTTARVLIGRIIVALLALEPSQAELAKEIGETLLASFTPQLRNLGFGVILDLLAHPMPEIQELGARILLNHEMRAVDLPADLIESLLASPHEPVRAIGVRLFGQLPDERLMSDRSFIIAMAVSAAGELRSAIRPAIRRLASNYPEFGLGLAGDFIEILVVPERHEGVHADVVRVMREDIPGWVSRISEETAMRLVGAKSGAVQELGGLVLKENRDRFVGGLETSEIVKLAGHEVLSVREAAREMFGEILGRLRGNSQEMLAGVRLLESKWEDSREFARRIFSTEFSAEDWMPEVMVSVCDSVREDVRVFGRDLVRRNFQEGYGEEYLLKFSEHPSGDMQVFATNYLESYAADNADRLRELVPYFVTVLCQVNRGRVAKGRIFKFLDKEAQKSEEAARIVAEILTRQSVTLAIGDKATAVEIMVRIRRRFPGIELPIQVKPVSEVRS
ncbi:HEAT repeat domain-containing protein [Kamptonema formosum]|uniref:HEAT repeat domain-containing protein n=1 Tax=Kamptonema formosum TaxID=331992 RepID=UPI00034B5EA5|nr:HEAT repeat domain-containing protein [Oscillatoria sp. PCC 10802]